MLSSLILTWAPSIERLPPDPTITTPHTVHRINYGKYYSYSKEHEKSREANMYFVFKPLNETNVPVIVEYHGGGFTGGAATRQVTAKIAACLENGIAWASMDYRLVATKYFYESAHGEEEEEFIHAAADGQLTLDSTGRRSSSYLVRIGRQEFNTKCSFDAAAGFEDLITRAHSLGVDMHRVAFTGGSAGGGEIHYLAWVYYRLDDNWRRYTPLGMVYTMAQVPSPRHHPVPSPRHHPVPTPRHHPVQLDYPVQNILDRVWGLWADDVGSSTPVSTILAQTHADCEMCIGNPWCSPAYTAQTELCNRSWHAATMARYCGADGEKMRGVTLRELRTTQVWPNTTEHDRGLATLWYNSQNMLAARRDPAVPRRPFHLYIANTLNGTAGMNVVHNALYARRYAEYAAAAGINYTTYYPDYEAMRPTDRAATRLVGANGVTFNYLSSHGASPLAEGAACACPAPFLTSSSPLAYLRPLSLLLAVPVTRR